MKRSIKPKATLWGTTLVDLREIRIYQDPTVKGSWAETYAPEKGKAPYIHIHPLAFEQPEIFDEIMMHEFVHVLEYMFTRELNQRDPKDCTQAATIFGRHLPRMLKYLKKA